MDFFVRVVSEIECWLLKSVQENKDLRLDLVGDSRLQAARCSTRAKHARRWTVILVGALQDKIGQLAIRLSRDWISRLSQVTRPSREPPLFWKTWRFTFSSYPSINTPYSHIWKSKIRLIHLQSIHKSLFKFLNSLPLHCQILERPFTKTLFSPFPLLWESCLVF